MLNGKKLSLSKLLTVGVVIILTVVPFFAFLTVWAASFSGHYTAWRLWDELILLLLMVGGVVFLLKDKAMWKRLKSQHVVWLILIYALYELIIGAISLIKHDVSLKALGYGLIVDLRFPLFFLVCLIVGERNSWIKEHWRSILLIPAAVVVFFGVAEHFLLPYDFLKHFGYGLSTIPPYETINQNLHYTRIISTMRGANPLGAYLIVIISALGALLVRRPPRKMMVTYGLLFIAALLSLFYSYSRGAWIGAGVSLAIVVVLNIKNKRTLKRLGLAAGTGIIVIGLALFSFRNSPRLQDTIFHTDTTHHTAQTSNTAHLSALKNGLKDVVHQPFGDGRGTAGPASVYNNHPARIAEDYFIQVAQEVGWFGVIVFLAINWLVAKGLWLKRRDSLSLALLASLVGISLVGLLSHVWVDDTLSYLWWGLAGVALSGYFRKNEPSTSK